MKKILFASLVFLLFSSFISILYADVDDNILTESYTLAEISSEEPEELEPMTVERLTEEEILELMEKIKPGSTGTIENQQRPPTFWLIWLVLGLALFFMVLIVVIILIIFKSKMKSTDNYSTKQTPYISAANSKKIELKQTPFGASSKSKAQPKYCTNCGNKIKKDTNFCANCGTQINI